MFRRHWSGLPKDAEVPSTLEGLGYFINDDDEIRSIAKPDCYYLFMIDRNERVNARQRFHFNLAIEDVIHQRLQGEGLDKITLPLGTPVNRPHVPIFASSALFFNSRIVLIVGDTMGALGLIAGRVANGRGGLDRGSATGLVRAIQQKLPGAGIVIANPGALHWWPEGGRTIAGRDVDFVPLSSLVSVGKRFVESVNRAPGHEDEMEHMARIFEFIDEKATKNVKINVFAIEKGTELVEKFLDDREVWASWGGRMESMVLMGTHRNVSWLKCDGFEAFLAKRCRAYTISSEPLDTPLAGPCGNEALGIPPLGTPVYSSSESAVEELMAITAQDAALTYFVEAAQEGFENPEMVVRTEVEDVGRMDDGVNARATWEDVGVDQRPVLEVVDERVLREQRMWNRWEETGVAEADEWDGEDGKGKEVEGEVMAAPATRDHH